MLISCSSIDTIGYPNVEHTHFATWGAASINTSSSSNNPKFVLFTGELPEPGQKITGTTGPAASPSGIISIRVQRDHLSSHHIQHRYFYPTFDLEIRGAYQVEL